MPIGTRMESRVEGLSSTVTAVQRQLDDHGDLLKSHGVDLHTIKEVLDKVILGQERLACAHEKLSGAQERFINAQSRVADELLALREGALGSGRRVQMGDGSVAGGTGSPGRPPESVDAGTGNYRRPDFVARRIELPVFDGADPDEWTYRADRFFGLHRLTAAEQLEAAVLCLEGSALSWFRWENQRRQIHTWDELKGLLLRRFRLAGMGTVFDRFFLLQKTSTVQEYRCRFEALAAAVGDMAEAALQAAFLKGLRPEIQAALRIL